MDAAPTPRTERASRRPGAAALGRTCARRAAAGPRAGTAHGGVIEIPRALRRRLRVLPLALAASVSQLGGCHPSKFQESAMALKGPWQAPMASKERAHTKSESSRGRQMGRLESMDCIAELGIVSSL